MSSSAGERSRRAPARRSFEPGVGPWAWAAETCRLSQAAPPRPELPGLRKAAVFLAQMSKEEAGVLLSKLRPREVESLTRELMRLGSVESEDVGIVMNEFHSLMTAQHFIGRGGVDFAREILAAGLGEDKAEGILSRLNVVYTEVPFASLRNADVRQLVTFLKDEHPQVTPSSSPT